MRNFSTVHLSDVAKREAMLVRVERITELPLLALAFGMIRFCWGPLLWDLSSVRRSPSWHLTSLYGPSSPWTWVSR